MCNHTSNGYKFQQTMCQHTKANKISIPQSYGAKHATVYKMYPFKLSFGTSASEPHLRSQGMHYMELLEIILYILVLFPSDL